MPSMPGSACGELSGDGCEAGQTINSAREFVSVRRFVVVLESLDRRYVRRLPFVHQKFRSVRKPSFGCLKEIQ
jgi:hypothetical protein